MIRKFNYTDRRKIRPEAVAIDRRDDADGLPRFSCHLALDSEPWPSDARVYVEAYARYGFKRFEAGSFGRVAALRDCLLPGFKTTDVIRFRVKVIDESGQHGLLLGIADAITPREANSDSGRRISLLPVVPLDLGQRVWKLEFRDDGPNLLVNDQVSDIFHRVANDPAFQALVLPEILRQVLSEILLRGEGADPWDEDEWQGRWLRFAMRFNQEEPPAAADTSDPETKDWIDEVIARFCEWSGSADRYRDVTITETEGQ